ncbi:hypothetical protein PT974_07172 [Cladobotryum mycophilum]|uniref:DUF7580 domain-containing protein n=1 Tax=Cladobotryum mycophilum TaxID=491253 RepID=A0ABR0SPQ9_9HYPO
MSFEAQLHCILLPQHTLDTSLDEVSFAKFCSQLQRLCTLLDSLVDTIILRKDDFQKEIDSALTTGASTYPSLTGLIDHMDRLIPDSTEVFDYLSGPNQKLFKFPEEGLKKATEILIESDTYLSRLFTSTARPTAELLQTAKRFAWEDTTLRDHALTVFDTLFESFTCQKDHQILMKLQCGLEGVEASPRLNLLLSCPGLDVWQEAICNPNSNSIESISEVHDICNQLQLVAGQNQELCLQICQQRLFGVWAWPTTGKRHLKTLGNQSLDQILELGSFKPCDAKSHFTNRSTVLRYKPREKRFLAMNLGYCLLDFFDAELNSKSIHFLVPAGSPTQSELPYISFASKLPTSPEFRNYKLGHPVLLSFAKLLLEIDEGERIPLEITLHREKNKQAYTDILDYLDELELERAQDAYLEAVRGCLNVHLAISKSLKNIDFDSKEAILKIREELYRHIVQRLEFAFDATVPKSKKRRLSGPLHDSPSISKSNLHPSATRPSVSSWNLSTDTTTGVKQEPPSKRSRPTLPTEKRETRRLPQQLESRIVFRARGIPRDWNQGTLQAFLEANIISAGLIVATVYFRTEPIQLQATSFEVAWSIPLDLPSPIRFITLDKSFHGLTTLHSPVMGDHKLDVIAISGIGSHAFGSFREKGGDHMWLRDSLPDDLIEGDTNRSMARIMIYGYESSIPGSESTQNLEDLAISFRHTLANVPKGKPIILIAHSLRGLVAIMSLSRSKLSDDQRLLKSIYGIVFFGVPHNGMNITSLVAMAGNGPNRFLVESIGSSASQILSIQQREFQIAFPERDDSEVFCFFETLQSPTAKQDEDGNWKMNGPKEVLVNKASATQCRPWDNDPGRICPINRNHSEMVKFRRNDPEYDRVIQILKGMARRALESQ